MESAIPERPLTGLLNGDLHANIYGETYLPFALYVQPSVVGPSLPASTFQPFPRLPRELQLHIIGFCDHATLFRLAQVSSKTRKEAQALFWSDNCVWYSICAPWVLSGGAASHTRYALEPMRSMTQIEIDFGKMRPFGKYFWKDGQPAPNLALSEKDIEQQIQNFWQVVQRRFPHATRVVISETLPWVIGSPLPVWHRILAEACPPHIQAYISSLRHGLDHSRRMERSLWQLHRHSKTKTASWEAVAPVWRRQSVEPPLKEFRGPVGAYSSWVHRRLRHTHMRYARPRLVLQAVQMHYLESKPSSFPCPDTSCNLHFLQPAEWVLHAIDASHDLKNMVLPSEQLQAWFAQFDSKRSHFNQQDYATLKSLRTQWGEEHSPERQAAEQAFLSQLEHDPLYAREVPPEQSVMWRDYLIDMNAKFLYY